MNSLLFIHLIAIGVWAGCVATEVVLEITQEKLPPNESHLAPLHAKIDRAVEIPAILVTLVTGGAMLHHATWDNLLVAKVSCGVAAVILNSIAAYTVHMRNKCLESGNTSGYAHYNTLHERIGIGCVISIISAIIIGGQRIAG
jgi:putative copper export protein